MPYEKKKVDGYQVRNKDTGKVHAKHTTKAKAEAQIRLMHGVEHGMQPRTTKQAAGLTKKGSKKTRSRK